MRTAVPGEPSEYLHATEKRTPHQCARASHDDVGDPLEQTTRYNDDQSWAREVDEFVRATRGELEIEHGSIDDAYRTMGLVYRIYCADADWRDRWNLRATPKKESS